MAENKINNESVGARFAETLDRAVMVPPGCAPAGPGAVSCWVAGVPAPQGSKRALGRRGGFGKVVMVESSKQVKPWREKVRQAFLARPHGASVLTSFPKGTPVIVKIVFVLPRTVAMKLKSSVECPMVQKPDVDKLARAVLDAISRPKDGRWAGVYADDSQVVACYAYKRRGEPGETPGAMIHVERMP
jgi:crossover junction endodeoxyribonuclease RusA